MAFRMKHWLGLVAVGCTLVAMWALPPRAVRQTGRELSQLPEEHRRDVILKGARHANDLLQRIRWADSLIPATLSAEGPVAFGFPESSDPGVVAAARARALEEVGGVTSDMAVGLFYLRPGTLKYPNAPQSMSGDIEYYFGARNGRTYCVAVPPMGRLDKVRLGRILGLAENEPELGLCAVLRTFGLPGPAVHQWLTDGGTDLAASAQPLVRGGQTVGTAPVRRRGPLGLITSGMAWYAASNVPYAQCLSGITEGCASVFRKPSSRRSPFWEEPPSTGSVVSATSPVSAMQLMGYGFGAGPHTVANLVRDFGPERFQQWWTADGDVAAAFQAAFGVDVGSWTLGEISKEMEITKPGPGVAWSGLLGGLLFMTLSSVFAGMWAIRRRVA